jgi:hypothetical protein
MTALTSDHAPRCIFTGEPLEAAHISLDHFVQRSYIAHDRIWNLVPIAPRTNSRKGARLPYPAAIDELAAFHSMAIDIASNHSIPGWARFRDEYAPDLRLDLPDILRPARLAEAYHSTIGSMLAIAKSMGFPNNWPISPRSD